MGRLGFLGLASKSLCHFRRFRKDLPSSVVNSEYFSCHGDRQWRQTLFHSRTIYNCSSNGTWIHSEIEATRTPSKRPFHATRSCYSTKQDFYDILGVPKDASMDEIRKAFLSLAKEYHPDANKNNPAAKRKFQEIRDAYETLRDSEKRAKYDEEFRGAATREYATEETMDFTDAFQDQFSDTFKKIFSEIFEHETEEFATDVQVDLVLSFPEAAKGCKRNLNFDAHVPCGSCNGRGYPIGAKPKICQTCKGFGTVTVPPFTSTCSTCKGFGRIVKESCTTCKGSGIVQGVKEVIVAVPAGVESGDTIRVPKAGNSGGRGAMPGNLYIRIKVAKDPIFQRDGADIYVDSHISFTQAILGGMVDVPTLSGKMQVKIPKGVQPGQLLVLRGRGLPKQGGFIESFGDQFVRFRVHVPTSLNERQRALMEEFAKDECHHESDSSSAGSWWRQIVDRLMIPSYMLEVSLILFMLLLLGKGM